MKKGFTLIELLVVVLIIGILSAVALPQYTKAVEKSRATEAITLLGNLSTAEQVYQMTTGSFTTDMSLLDLQLPGIVAATPSQAKTKNFNLTVTSASPNLTAVAERANNGTVVTTGDNQYAITLTITPDGVITRKCQQSKTSTTVNSICKSIANGNAQGEIK